MLRPAWSADAAAIRADGDALERTRAALVRELRTVREHAERLEADRPGWEATRLRARAAAVRLQLEALPAAFGAVAGRLEALPSSPWGDGATGAPLPASLGRGDLSGLEAAGSSSEADCAPRSGPRARLGWHLRGLSQRITRHRGHRWCGRSALGSAEALRGADGRVRFGNVATCGQVWECATCGPGQLAPRAQDLSNAVQKWQAQGGRTYLLTFTMRRPLQCSDRLIDPLCRLLDSWELFRGSDVWRDLREWAPLHVRGLEATAGRSGWHAHLHLLWFAPFELDAEQLEALRMRLAIRWARSVARGAGDAWIPRLDKVGTDLRPCEAAAYLAKIGLEMTDGGRKEGRAAGRLGPWQVLAMTEHLDREIRAWAIERWRDFAETMRGRKKIFRSDALRAFMDAHKDEQDAEPDPELIARIDAPTWRIISRRPIWLEHLAQSLERGEAGSLAATLRAAGMPRRLAEQAQAAVTQSAHDRERQFASFAEALRNSA